MSEQPQPLCPAARPAERRRPSPHSRQRGCPATQVTPAARPLGGRLRARSALAPPSGATARVGLSAKREGCPPHGTGGCGGTTLASAKCSERKSRPTQVAGGLSANCQVGRGGLPDAAGGGAGLPDAIGAPRVAIGAPRVGLDRQQPPDAGER